MSIWISIEDSIRNSKEIPEGFHSSFFVVFKLILLFSSFVAFLNWYYSLCYESLDQNRRNSLFARLFPYSFDITKASSLIHLIFYISYRILLPSLPPFLLLFHCGHSNHDGAAVLIPLLLLLLLLLPIYYHVHYLVEQSYYLCPHCYILWKR